MCFFNRYGQKVWGPLQAGAVVTKGVGSHDGHMTRPMTDLPAQCVVWWCVVTNPSQCVVWWCVVTNPSQCVVWWCVVTELPSPVRGVL